MVIQAFVIPTKAKKTAYSVSHYPLVHLAILDSGSTIHIFNKKSWFLNYRDVPKGDVVVAGITMVLVIGYGDIEIRVKGPRDYRFLRIPDVAYYQNFACNLVSLQLLRR